MGLGHLEISDALGHPSLCCHICRREEDGEHRTSAGRPRLIPEPEISGLVHGVLQEEGAFQEGVGQPGDFSRGRGL